MGNSYTSKNRRPPFEFELDGVPFICPGGISMLDMCEMARLADLDADSVEGAAAIADMFKGALGKVDYERFRAHTRSHHTDTDTVLEILKDMVEHVTAGPTTRSTSSVGGPQTIDGMSTDSSPFADGRELSDEEIARIRAAITGQS